MNKSIQVLRKIMSKLGLSDSLKKMRDVVKNQEMQLKNTKNSEGFEETQLVSSSHSSKEREITTDNLVSSLGPLLHGTESDISQVSNWSCSFDTINTSISELKTTLKNKDVQIISLVGDIESLKKGIKKLDKKLKEQKVLLKAERETFECYKKDTCKGIKKHKSEEFQDSLEQKHRSSKEMQKLKSELTHYKQLYSEQIHKADCLAKQISNLKHDNISLKGKLIDHERRSNKFILDMTKRFDNSRKEMNLVMSKDINSFSTFKQKEVMYKIVERNTRLAYDNSMLKHELNRLKEQVIEKSSDENKLKCSLSINKLISSNLSNKISEELNKNNEPRALTRKKAGLNIGFSSHQIKNVEGHKEKFSWQQILEKKSSGNLNMWDCMTRLSDGSEYMSLVPVRSYSLPSLCH